MPPSIWTYSDGADRGFGLFKRRIFQQLQLRGWTVWMAEAPLLEPQSKSLLQNDLLQRKPDWVFLINQSAAQLYEYLAIPASLRPLPCKKWIWFLDDPHFFTGQPFEAGEYVFSFDSTYLDYLQSLRPGGCGLLPLGCDCEEEGIYKKQYACDVCFVGGAIDQSARRSQLPPDMQAYVDLLVEKKLHHREKTFEQLVLEYPIAPGKQIQIPPPVAHYLYWETNNRYRIQTLEALADYDLRIYGNEDWPKLLQNSPLLNRFHGPIDPVKELPSVFVSAKINLNIHSVQCRGSLNQRDYNASAAGGFLLSDWVPAAGRFFAPGKEAIYWSSIEDLRWKIAHYLKEPQERRRIIQRGRARVARDHMYAQRVEQALSVLEKMVSPSV